MCYIDALMYHISALVVLLYLVFADLSPLVALDLLNYLLDRKLVTQVRILRHSGRKVRGMHGRHIEEKNMQDLRVKILKLLLTT
jgi:hypothetical protein